MELLVRASFSFWAPATQPTASKAWKGIVKLAYPGVLEGTLIHLSGLLLEFLDNTLVDATELVDQVSGCGGLAGIDMTNDDDVQVCLFLTHLDKLCNLPGKKANIQYSFAGSPVAAYTLKCSRSGG